MSRPVLDLDRFRKCVGLMRGGATAGERAAGEAAAVRVAASAGLSLAEALARLDGPVRGQPVPPRQAHGADHASAWSRARRKPEPKTQPITVEEMRAAKARRELWLKRKAAAEEKRLRAVRAAQEAANAVLREEQSRRDREWAETRSAPAAD